jgi:hypothetical protein
MTPAVADARGAVEDLSGRGELDERVGDVAARPSTIGARGIRLYR